MRALVKTAPGTGNLELCEMPLPEIGDADLLVKVSFCGICGSDLHIEDGIHPCSPPVVIGHEFSGTVAAAGKAVTDFQEGDAVAFLKGWSPYPGVGSDGGFAEYMRAPADCMWKTPDGVTQEEATQFETICTPMGLVRDVAAVQEGESVVITGPGMIGLLAANVAAIERAGRVIVIGTPGDQALRLPMALEMGADEALVWGEETRRQMQELAPPCWIDASGAAPALKAAVECLGRHGRLIVAGLGHGPWDLDMARVAYNSLTIRGVWGGPGRYVTECVPLIRSGQLKMSVPLSVMPMTQWQDAFGLLRRQGAVKILLDPSL